MPGLALLNGHLYMVINPQNYLIHYDRDGNRFEDVQMDYTPYAIAASQELERLLVMGSDEVIHVYSVTDEGEIEQEVGQIRDYLPAIFNRDCHSILWVDLHRAGQLWFHTARGPNNEVGNHAWEFAVDTDNWELGDLRQCFATNPGDFGAHHSDGLGHDGENLWVSCWDDQVIQIMEDGVAEPRWLRHNPHDRVLEAGDEMEVTITIDARGLIGGDYQANLIFASPEDEWEAVTISVRLEVASAADLEVTWLPEIGCPDVVDFNRIPGHFGEVFTGVEYAIPLTIANVGVEDLSIERIEVDQQFFTEDGDAGVICPRESQLLEVTLLVPEGEAGGYQSVLTIISDDPDEAEATIPLLALVTEPPVILVEPDAFQVDLNEENGGFTEEILNITNAGESTLRFAISSELIMEGGRDLAQRDVRSAAQRGPERDEPGDIIAEFIGPKRVNQYWSPIGWDPDNEIMYLSGYSANIIVAYTHDDYEDFLEVRRFVVERPMDGGWHNGVIYICNLEDNMVLRRYNVNGENLGDLAMGFITYGVAFDQPNNLLFALTSANGGRIRVFEMNGIDLGQETGVINDFVVLNDNFNPSSLEWVGSHQEGQLWLPDPPNLNQILVDTENWQAVERVSSFNAAISQPYDGCIHDGFHM